MIFKVFYQETLTEVAVRERTNALYVEGESERDVRRKLAPRKLNIEFVQKLHGSFLEYEKENVNFELENL
jgi:DNA-dependent RNA polymerase auxiliary subunit epsilon